MNPDLPDTTDTDWKCLNPLGGGAQAKVYKVEHIRTGEVGAMKLLTDTDDFKALQRFRDEVKAIGQLFHPNLVKIKDESREGEHRQFYVMEYIEGLESLADLMRAQRNPFKQKPLEALDAYIQLLVALQVCHKANIVHRDVSHKNVMVTPDGRIKLIDFGLCHLKDSARMTGIGEAVGTFGFRAPECNGYDSSDDPRTDLYSAAKVLWAMVTNQPGFEREEMVFDPDRLSLVKLIKELPMAWHLQRIFEGAIRHNKSDRYKNAEAAINHALAVRLTIIDKYPPIELLVDGTCQVCGVGTLGGGNNPGLVAPDQNTEREINAVLKTSGLHFGEGTWICNYCYHISFSIDFMTKKVIAARKNLR